MHKISKTFRFSAAHQLEGLPPEHKCSRLHGHNYEVTVTLRDTELDIHGFILDYGEMGSIRGYIDSTLDHRNLNDVFKDMGKGHRPTTAENLALILFHRFKQMPKIGARLWAVAVRETPDTWAEYSEGGE